jgi:voltage-gated potassium channel
MTEYASPVHRLTPELWRKWTEWPLVGVAVVFLVTFSIQVIADVPAKDAGDYDAIIWATWAVFVVDYVVNLVLAERRGRWFIRNLHEAAILALPMLRPLRLLRLLFILRITHRAAGRALRGRVLTYALGAAVLLTYIAALAVLDAEQNVPGSKIHTIGDAWWWACVTISTVGYGDLYPVTLEGRLVGIALMIGGVAVIGLVAGSMASWIIDQVGNRVSTEAATDRTELDEVRTQLADVTARLATVTQLLESQGSAERPRPER